jgi:Uncharacterized protein conserved in bacteria (DUF2330)
MTDIRVRRLPRRLSVVGAFALAMLAAPLVAGVGAAQACACGLFSPARGGSATVTGETALVRSTGAGLEDVYLSLTLDSDVRSGALLFPVPDRHVRVSAGPAALFTDLTALTTPRRVSAAGAGDGNGAAAAPQVVVEKRQAIGPLDVVTLSARTAPALDGWLTRNGFTVKPALNATVQSYLDAGWAFVAVRLRPEAGAPTRLDGRLDPLHLRFRTARLVYPMRLSHHARESVRVTLYTLGADPLELSDTPAGMGRVYAARVPAGSGAALAALTGGRSDYLTRYDGTLRPADITSDFHLRPAASDTAGSPRPPDSFELPLGGARVPGAAVALIGALLGTAALVTLAEIRRGRRLRR